MAMGRVRRPGQNNFSRLARRHHYAVAVLHAGGSRHKKRKVPRLRSG
jgi:hypothetical protein